MLERIKNEPVIITVIVLAVINVLLGGDGNEIVETIGLLVGGGVARQQVIPTRKVNQ